MCVSMCVCGLVFTILVGTAFLGGVGLKLRVRVKVRGNRILNVN